MLFNQTKKELIYATCRTMISINWIFFGHSLYTIWHQVINFFIFHVTCLNEKWIILTKCIGTSEQSAENLSKKGVSQFRKRRIGKWWFTTSPVLAMRFGFIAFKEIYSYFTSCISGKFLLKKRILLNNINCNGMTMCNQHVFGYLPGTWK